MRMSRNRKRLACALLCAGTVFAGTRIRRPTEDAPRPYEAYYEQVPFTLMLTAPAAGEHHFAFGPWRLGARLRQQRGSDRHPNLYLVVPGTQHRNLAGGDEWDHNTVLSAAPQEGQDWNWDIFGAISLDPTLHAVRGERELLIAGEAAFTPGDLFEFDDLPSAQFLREFLQIETLGDLAPYRRADGRLPRLIILPAGYSVKARKAEPVASAPKPRNEPAPVR